SLLLLAEPGDDDVAGAPADHGPDNALDLLRRLALTEDHLRRPLAAGPAMVHAGVAQVLETGPGQEPGGLLRRHVAGPDRLQQGQQFLSFHIVSPRFGGSRPPVEFFLYKDTASLTACQFMASGRREGLLS